MTEATYEKPLPIPSVISEPHWAACREHRLMVQRCQHCGAYYFPPSIICPECLSRQVEWTQVSGRGRVFSFIVFHRVYHPGFKEDVPYTVALIELEEGARILSNVVGIPPSEVKCDMPVEVIFDDVTPEVTLPKFRPRSA